MHHMKSINIKKTIFTIIALLTVAPAFVIAQPSNPGGDPFPTPVDGNIVAVLIIAFLFGGYRVYKLHKDSRGARID